MSSKLQNTDFSLKVTVANILDGNYSIPKFQRDFVWKKSDIASLADSIIRGYPISSMLLMPCDGCLSIASEPLKTFDAHESEDKNKKFYVLDGQQRLTSIAKIFCNMDASCVYFYDMHEILLEEFPEHEIKVPSLGKIKNDGFCRYFTKSKNLDEEATRHNFRFISGKVILNGEYSSVIRKFLKTIENLSDDDVKYDQYNNYLNKLFGDLTNFEIPMTLISKDADLGVVCRVFEKVNSSGIKLTTFDLINAKSFDYEKYESGIISYMEKDLLDYVLKNPNMSDFLHYFLKMDANYKFNDLSRISRILMCNDLLNQNKVPAITNHNMLSKKSDFWFEQWDTYKDDIFEYFNWLNNQKFYDLTSVSYLEYLGAVVIHNVLILTEPLFLTYIKKYALGIGFKSKNFSKSDIEYLSFLNNAMKNYLSSSDFDKYKHIPKDLDIIITESEVEHCSKTSNAHRVFIYLMLYEKNGFFNNDLLDLPINPSYDFDEHHIIPKSRIDNKDSSIFSGICNITLLNKNSNRNEIKNKTAMEYLKFLQNLHGEVKFKYLCNQNFIPLDFVNDDDFVHKRKILLLDFINNFFKN